MGNKLFTVLAFLFVFAANAQKITEKDLAGQWKIVAVTEPGIHLDFVANVFRTTEKFATDNPEYSPAQLKEIANDRLDYLRESYLIFAPGSILFMINSNEEPAYFKYTLHSRDGKQYLLYNETGSSEEIYIKDGLLYKIGSNESQGTDVYKKEKL